MTTKPWVVHHGDCLVVLKTFADNSLDSIVSDPPYGLSNHDSADVIDALNAWISGKPYVPKGAGFMGKTWDAFVPGPEVWKECYRVLKPGGHLLAFAGTRTVDLMGIALRLAGFEVRDSVAWMHGQGFPKSLNVSKALDKAAGADRKVVGKRDRYRDGHERENLGQGDHVYQGGMHANGVADVTEAATDQAKQWEGWGTALKPSFEPILVMRKPLVGTVIENVVAHGTGALNIDGCRIAPSSNEPDSGAMYYHNRGLPMPSNRQNYFNGKDGVVDCDPIAGGRWPANVILGHNDGCRLVGTKKVKPTNGSGVSTGHNRTEENMGGYDGGWQKDTATSTYLSEDGTETVDRWECEPGCQVAELDQQSGNMAPGSWFRTDKARHFGNDGQATGGKEWRTPLDNGGGASRFFYTAKASKRERTANGRVENKHVTVKPLALMRYLCRLVTPPGGTVLDPFTGSGTTGVAALQEGFEFIGIEREEASVVTARQRCALAGDNTLWIDPPEVNEIEDQPDQVVLVLTLDSLLGL